MPQQKVSFKHRLEYALFSAVVRFSRFTPAWGLRAEASSLVFFFKRFSRRHFRLVESNLTAAFPDASPHERRDLQDRIYGHFGRLFVEIIRTFARRQPQAILARSRILHPEFIEHALMKKRGLLVFSAHFGNWEWLPLILHTRFKKNIFSVARPMDNPLIEGKVRNFREAMGSIVIYKKNSLRHILAKLADNEIVCLLIDQNAVPREGVFVDFFGRKASTITSVAQLHLKKNIPVLPAFLHYEGREIVLEIQPEIKLPRSGNEHDDLLALTQHMTGLIEGQIRRFPEQWLWFHDRWKTRPKGAVHESP
jgi:KDO2-lipid IV(A) lauroyltransferase